MACDEAKRQAELGKGEVGAVDLVPLRIHMEDVRRRLLLNGTLEAGALAKSIAGMLVTLDCDQTMIIPE